MKRILAFGDSNTWGYNPVIRERYDSDIRWTGLLQKALGDNALILEEGLCGRTTIFDDENKEGRNGFTALSSILKNLEPIDAAIIMLGTNDCKSTFGLTSEVISAGMELCIAKLKEYVKSESILLISPILLENEALKRSYDSCSLSVSRELKQAYLEIAEAYGTAFLAASDAAKACDTDGEHLSEEGHRALYEAVLRFFDPDGEGRPLC